MDNRIRIATVSAIAATGLGVVLRFSARWLSWPGEPLRAGTQEASVRAAREGAIQDVAMVLIWGGIVLGLIVAHSLLRNDTAEILYVEEAAEESSNP